MRTLTKSTEVLEVANNSGTKRVDTILEMGSSSKSHKSRRNFLFYLVIAAIAVSAAFTSCSKDDKDSVAAAAPVTSISGTLDNSLASYTEIGVSFDGGSTFVKKVPISNKSFTLDLSGITPPASALRTIDEGEGSIKYTISDKSAKTASLSFYAIGNDGLTGYTYISQGTKSTTSMTEVEYIYVDKDVTMTGSGSDTDDGIKYTATVNVNAKKGWNSVVMTYTTSATQQTMNQTSGAAPAGVSWIKGSVWGGVDIDEP